MDRNYKTHTHHKCPIFTKPRKIGTFEYYYQINNLNPKQHGGY